MKVLIPDGIKFTTKDEKLAAQATASEISFTREGNNDYVAMIHLKLPNSGAAGDHRTAMVDIPLRLSCAAETTKKGVSRIVYKVTTPYQSLTSDEATPTSPIHPEQSRSGAAMTTHLVQTLPAVAKRDRAGTNGDLARRGCNAQRALQFALLKALSAAFTSAFTNVPNTGDTEWSADAVIFTTVGKEIDTGRATDASYDAVALVRDSGRAPNIVVTKGTDCAPVVDVSDLADAPCIASPLERGLNGLAPLTDDTQITVEAAIAGSYEAPES